jgi:hypothetical protein
MMLLTWLACTESDDTSLPTSIGPREVPWDHGLPATGPAPRGWRDLRSIVHLHSPWSHDACDNDPQPDGATNEPCLADLRAGLCATRIDVAFVTDHPEYAAAQPYDDLFHAREGDTPLEEGGTRVGNQIHCEDGHAVTWLPGIEDELMPVALDRQVAGEDAAENDRLYNGYDEEALGAARAAGAEVLVAHTEGRSREDLERLQDAGLAGVELFNLHAMFDPDIRAEDLGLDPLGWAAGITPFTSPDASGEPDLYFLGVFEEQAPSLAHWDALLARGRTVAVAGTDAHQNVLPLDLRDGERGDSYRRMLRWFSNHLLAEGEAPSQVQAALTEGRVYVAFEAFGTPVGFDVRLEAEGRVYEMGSDAPPGILAVSCPALHPFSPRGLEEPVVEAVVFKDGAEWARGCGEHRTDGSGAYRVRIDVTPHHLLPFLGDEPEPWLRPFPWVYSNALRVGG